MRPALSRGRCPLRPYPFGSKPHTWPPAIGKLNSSSLQHSSYNRQRLVAGISTRLDLGDGVAVNADLFRQLLDGPIQ